MADTTLTLIVTPGENFPDGQPITLAALRRGATPVVQIQGTISTTTIADGSVTEPKIATGAVTTSKLADGSVTEPKLADGAVSARALANSVVSDVKILGQLTAAVLQTFNASRGGIVPAPTAADRNSYLRGDGTWSSAETYNAMSAIFASQNFI